MQTKILVILFAILLAVGLNVHIPSLDAAPRDYCEGFQNPPVPVLTEEPFVFHSAPVSSNWVPIAIADWDNDGDPDTAFAENMGSFIFRPIQVIDNLIMNRIRRSLAPNNLERRAPIYGKAPTAPLDEQIVSFHGVAAVDLDNDGLQDLIVTPYYQPGVPIMFFRNLGGWQFEFYQQDYLENLLGFDATSDWGSETIIVADLTGDGLIDIYIPFYAFKPPYQSIFLRNTGSGFAEEAIQRGIGIEDVPIELRPEGAQAIDIDEDGDLDIYVASHFFINDGSGYFIDMRETYGLPNGFDEGVAFIDYDNDGLLDLYLRIPDPNLQLFRNTGNGFINVSVNTGLTCLTQNLEYFWGDSWADFDNDGDLDLLYTFDFSAPSPKYALFLNQGNGTFNLGFKGTRFMLLPATGDFDFDGDLDIASLYQIDKNILAKPVGTKVLAVVPVDEQSKPNEFGATVHVRNECNGSVQTRVIGANNVYLAQGDYAAHFAVDSACNHQVEVKFLRKGLLDKQSVIVPYSPSIEDSLRILVGRNGHLKKPYAVYQTLLPIISK